MFYSLTDNGSTYVCRLKEETHVYTQGSARFIYGHGHGSDHKHNHNWQGTDLIDEYTPEGLQAQESSQFDFLFIIFCFYLFFNSTLLLSLIL